MGGAGPLVYGDPARERLQLNEDSFWSGGPSRNDNPDALGALVAVPPAIFEGRYTDAESMLNRSMTARQLHGSLYQPIGELVLSFPGHEGYNGYRRELSLRRAVFTATYEVGAVTFTREVFASQPDQLLVVRVTADQPAALAFTPWASGGPLKTGMRVLDASTQELTGRSASHEGVSGQVKFDARVRVLNTGGVTTAATSGVAVRGADEALILISMATNFVDYATLTADETALATAALAAAAEKPYAELLAAHCSPSGASPTGTRSTSRPARPRAGPPTSGSRRSPRTAIRS
jgi:alpha-L-fucosidase 2